MTLPRFAILICLFSLTLSVAKAESYQITVKKAARTLELQKDGKLVKTYRIALGSSPVGAKERQGDRKTPEGTYYICNKNAQSRFYLSLGISYPNSDDAKRGLAQKLINQKEYDAIVKAQKNHGIPPWNTKLGGEVFIHGNGSSQDWTWGCVALDDPDIKELFQIIPIGTEVVITP